MSQYIEFQGKNVDLALQEAGERLNKPIEKLRYEVVSYGSSGIFGLVGVKKAKIRIKSEDAFGVDQDTKAQARDLVKDAFQIKDEPSSTKGEARPPKQKSQNRERRRNNHKVPVNKKRPDPETPRIKRPEPSPESVEKSVAIGKEALQRIADFITSDAAIEVSASSQRIIFKVESENSGLLIGKRGQTLEAMQYLVEKIVNKQGKDRCRVLVDVEGYLETRKTNLEKMASTMAEKAQKTLKPVTIGQMNAYDRRTVHVHLKSNNKVRTQSVGEGYYRKLIIFPKKRRRKKATK